MTEATNESQNIENVVEQEHLTSNDTQSINTNQNLQYSGELKVTLSYKNTKKCETNRIRNHGTNHLFELFALTLCGILPEKYKLPTSIMVYEFLPTNEPTTITADSFTSAITMLKAPIQFTKQFFVGQSEWQCKARYIIQLEKDYFNYVDLNTGSKYYIGILDNSYPRKLLAYANLEESNLDAIYSGAIANIVWDLQVSNVIS